MDGDSQFHSGVLLDASKVFHRELDSCTRFHRIRMDRALRRATDTHFLARCKSSFSVVIWENHHPRENESDKAEQTSFGPNEIDFEKGVKTSSF